MALSTQAFQEIVDFVSYQNAYIKKIAHTFMNLLGLNYFGAANIQHGHKNILSALNTIALAYSLTPALLKMPPY